MTVSLTVPFNIVNGTTGDATQVMANFNAILAGLMLQAASAGANTDITSLGGLVTPITPAQGGAIGLAGAVGYTAKNNAGTPNTQIDIAWKQALLVNSLNALQYGSAGAVTLNFSTVGVANGLDAGSIAASTIYYLYLIGNGTLITSLASLSSTAPTMPAGYTFLTRVGAWETGTGSALLPLVAFGSITQFSSNDPTVNTTAGFFRNTAVQGTVGGTDTLAAVTFGGLPPTAVEALGSIMANANTQIAVGPAAGSMIDNRAIAGAILPAATGSYRLAFRVPLITPQVINYANNDTGNALLVYGWRDGVNVC